MQQPNGKQINSNDKCGSIFRSFNWESFHSSSPDYWESLCAAYVLFYVLWSLNLCKFYMILFFGNLTRWWCFCYHTMAVLDVLSSPVLLHSILLIITFNKNSATLAKNTRYSAKMVWNVSAKLRMKIPNESCDTSGVDSTCAHSTHTQVNCVYVYAFMCQRKRWNFIICSNWTG